MTVMLEVTVQVGNEESVYTETAKLLYIYTCMYIHTHNWQQNTKEENYN
jgi:hypothetical protein